MVALQTGPKPKRAAELLGVGIASRVPADYFIVPREAGQSLVEFYRLPLE